MPDIHTQSRPEEVRVTHADLDLEVDFEQHCLEGRITWKIERVPGSAPEAPLVLDTKGLEVRGARTGRPGRLSEASMDMGPPDPVRGRALTIPLRPGHDHVEVRYRTTAASAGLQWLAPAQTADGSCPFLFTQGQAILARTFVPCQDTPGVRFTYQGRVRVPSGLEAVMAARNLGRDQEGAFRFEMPEPIPAYLLALAVGRISFRELGPRTGVYAEPSVLDRAAWEFVDTEEMVRKAEELYGPYRWERYDLIVLPPSFPFGGMENPRLTFATPTVLAGDRSLVALVAHELAHSWSGNLVTNATWSDFWLNEGFTVYFERRILEAIYGRPRAEMEAALGRRNLVQDLRDLPEGDTVLNIELAGRDPDDAFSTVPYEKGYLFLRLLEETVGRQRFDRFLQTWFEENAFQSRTTAEFEDYLRTALFAGDLGGLEVLDVAAWLHRPGLPENAPNPISDAFERAEGAAREFLQGTRMARDLPADTWTTHEWLRFLHSFPEQVSPAQMAEIDAAWGLSRSGNAEILMEWLLQAIRSGYEPAQAALEAFLTSQGRRKFLKPLYTELARTTAGKERALAIYRRARPTYHPISTNTIDAILGLRP